MRDLFNDYFKGQPAYEAKEQILAQCLNVITGMRLRINKVI